MATNQVNPEAIARINPDLITLAGLRAKEGTERRAMAIAFVREDPVRALQLIDDARASRELTLTISGQSRLFDDVLGEIDDPEEAREIMEQYLTPEFLAWMISARGDLPSVVHQVASAEMIFAAFLTHTNEENSSPYMIIAWAMQLKDRDDWEEMLDFELASEWTLEQFLISAVLDEYQDDYGDDFDDYPAHLWEDVGVDLDRAREEFEWMVESKYRGPLRMDATDIALGQKMLREMRERFETEPTFAAEVADVADDLDI